MRVADECLQCIVFLARRSGNGLVSRATGFLVDNDSVPFLITAKHNVHGLGHGFVARANAEGNASVNVTFPTARWWFHHDKFVDVAVTYWPEFPLVRSLFVKSEDIPSLERIRTKQIGIGDEVASFGLYHRTPGERRIMPIVRCGTIAMMPEEQIPISLLDETGVVIDGGADAFLIETKSVGGFSGSPVFVAPYRPGPQRRTLPSLILLGLVPGHWEVKGSVSFGTEVNEGIVHVVPGQKILEVFNQPEVIELRNDIKTGRFKLKLDWKIEQW